MKGIKKIMSFVLTFALMAFVVPPAFSGYSVKGADISSSQAYAEAMQPGWNLGNTFDGFDTNGDRGEESWGNPKVTKELIHTIKEQGFKSIRMPFTAEMRTGAAPDYKIDETFLARYAEVVNWALDEGLYVMINVHHDSWRWAYNIGTDDGTAMKRYTALWTQLADYFKDYPETVCFESLNEPYFVGTDAEQIVINNTVNETFYHLIRNSGGNNGTRMLVLPTLNTNDSQDRCTALYESIKSLNDENIMATFHYYGYWPFSVNIAGCTTFGEETITALEEAFDRANNTFTKNGIGVICGEYGLLGFDTALDTVQHGEILKYFEYANYYANQKDITMILWDNGQHMNRYTYKWGDQSLYDMMKASWTGRSSYADVDYLFVTDSTKNQDQTVSLTLNGNALVSISDESGMLVEGKDYTYNNNKVTFKGEYINSKVTSTYGVNETLIFKFSQGADWTMYIDLCKTAVLSSAQGQTSGFNIPTAFNGNRLITMEAKDAEGNGVGPQNWTSYKQFAYAFAPNYDQNTITIKKEFFDEASNGTIYLTFHWLNGETTTYTMVRSGASVVGTATQVVEPTPTPEATPEPTPTPEATPEVTPTPEATQEPAETTDRPVKVDVTTTVNGSVNQTYVIEADQSTVDLSKLAVRYYFTKADAKAMNFWCDNAGLQLNVAPWYKSLTASVNHQFVQTIDGYYLEITLADDTVLAPNTGNLTLGVRFVNEDWSGMSDFAEQKVSVLYDEKVVK